MPTKTKISCSRCSRIFLKIHRKICFESYLRIFPHIKSDWGINKRCICIMLMTLQLFPSHTSHFVSYYRYSYIFSLFTLVNFPRVHFVNCLIDFWHIIIVPSIACTHTHVIGSKKINFGMCHTIKFHVENISFMCLSISVLWSIKYFVHT